MAKSAMDGFANIAIELTPFDSAPDINNDIDQTLARLIGWDDSNKTWRPVQVLPNGQLSVTSAESTESVGSYSAAAVGIIATVIAAANTDRKRIVVTNNHTDTLYIGFDNSVLVATGFPINAGEHIEITEYNGAVYGIMPTVEGDARVLEF